MQANLGWAAQAEHESEKPGDLRQKLKGELGKAIARQTVRNSHHQPGTRLVREWHGKVYSVTIVDEGYAWNGRTYRSLSQIATEITGVRWSGPRFFGLKGTGR